MIELMQAVGSWWSLVLVVLVFGFAPGFVLGLVVRLYPVDHVRRRELLAEYHGVPRLMRPVWVGEQLGLVLWEGPPARLEARRARREARRRVAAAAAPVRFSGRLTEMTVTRKADVDWILDLARKGQDGVFMVRRVQNGHLRVTVDLGRLTASAFRDLVGRSSEPTVSRENSRGSDS